MKRKIFAQHIILENDHCREVISRDDIREIVSQARETRSEALTRNIQDFINPAKEEKKEFAFTLFQQNQKL